MEEEVIKTSETTAKIIIPKPPDEIDGVTIESLDQEINNYVRLIMGLHNQINEATKNKIISENRKSKLIEQGVITKEQHAKNLKAKTSLEVLNLENN